MPAFEHILVPTDFSESSELALSAALELAAKLDAKVTVLHAVWLPPYYSAYVEGLVWPTEELEEQAKRELAAWVRKAKERHANVDAVFVAGDPAERILEVAKESGVDLIVMGTHGRRGISHVLLGSIAEKTVRLSPIPVMTVRPEAQRRAKEKAFAERGRSLEK